MLQNLTPTFPPKSAPATLPSDQIIKTPDITPTQNPTIMETENHGEELYSVPISYGRNKDTDTCLTVAIRAQEDNPQEKHKATWKKIPRPKQNTTNPVDNSEGMNSVGKKRQISHAAFDDA